MIDMTGDILGQDSNELIESLPNFVSEIVFQDKISLQVCPVFSVYTSWL